MSYLEAIISGVIQGLTEFLPVSSSGHLVILHHFFSYKQEQLFFDIILHIGTLFTILVYFWYDIIRMIKERRRLLGLIIIGSIPTAIIGFIFKDIFESIFLNIKAVGFMLIVTAAFLFAGEWVSYLQNKNNAFPGRLSWIKAIIIGVIQGIAIIPGISRSGSTIATGLMLGLDKEEAVRFSFLLAIPAISGALLLKLADAKTAMAITPQFIVGSVVAFLFGLLAISVLFKAVSNSRLKYFGIYCLMLGCAVQIF